MFFLVVLASMVVIPTVDDVIKLDLKGAKYKAAFEGGSELVGYNEGDEKAFFYTNGEVTLTAKAPAAGEYTLTINASCTAAMKENAKFNVSLDGKEVARDFTLKTEDQKDYEFTVKLKEGDNKLVITYTNDVYKENEYDRNLYLHTVSLKKK